MMDLLSFALRALEHAVTWERLGEWMLRLTVIAGIGHLLLALLARASAAIRHLVAMAALIAIVAVPLATVVLPSWPLAVWPANLVITTPPPALPPAPDGVNALVATPALLPTWTHSQAKAATSAAASFAPEMGPRATAPPLALPAALAVVALAVAAGLLLRVALGLIAAWRIAETAQEVRDLGWRRELSRARERLGIWEAVELRISSRVSVPAVSGLFQPVLLLPPEALTWDGERRTAVLLHELAHVRRRDAATLLLSRIATASLWFQPLAWTLARVARRECERACDDVVLSSGMRASDYAGHLLSIARAAGRERLAVGMLAFSRRSSLEGRLLSLLRQDVGRGPASKRVAALVGGALLLLLLPLASVRVVAAPRVAKPDRGVAQAPPTTAVVSSTAGRGETEAGWDAAQAVNRDDAAWPAAAPPGKKDMIARVEMKSGETWYDRARALYQQEQYVDAGAAYENAARAGQRSATAWYNAACSYALGGRRLRALSCFEQALDAGFDRADLIQSDDDLNSIRSDARFRMLLDRALNSEGKEAKAEAPISRYRALRDANSSDAAAWGSVGIERMRAGETEQAVDAFQHQIALGGSASAIYNLACAHALSGDADQAIEALGRAIAAGYGDGEKLTSDSDLSSLGRDPRFARLVRLADDLTLYGSDRDDDQPASWRRSLARFERVAREHPDMGRAWFNLGYGRLRAGDARGGLEGFGRALDLGYRTPTTLYNLACSAAQAGDRDGAFRWLERAEAAGMDLQGMARGDRDLDPLRTDPRFRARAARWDRERLTAKGRNGKKD